MLSNPVLLSVLLALLPFGHAQTTSLCNPTEKSCPPNRGLKSETFSTNFAASKSLPPGWVQEESAGNILYGPTGAEFRMAKSGESPGLNTDFYFLFGYTEVKMKTSPGAGVISTYVLLSDDLDEIDWEFVGKEDTTVQANYFRKGDDGTYDRGSKHNVRALQTEFHTFGVNWTSSALTYLIDGQPVRTVRASEAKGKFPQTPMRLKLGIWAGGDEKTRTKDQILWAGGATDWSKAPYSMFVESVKIINYSPAEQYRWMDKSGSWESIEIIGGGKSKGIEQGPPPNSSAAPSGSAIATPSSAVSKVAAPETTATPAPTAAAPKNGTALTSTAKSNATSSTAKPAQATTAGAGSLAIPSFVALGLMVMSVVL